MATLATSTSRLSLPRLSRGKLLVGLLVIWLVLGVALRGKWTLSLAAADLTGLHRWFNDANGSISANRNSSPFFLYFFNEIRLVIDHLVVFIQGLIAQPAYNRPVPVIGWLGVVALVTFIASALGNLRVGALALIGFTFLGLQGLWQESMDTLALTLSAVLLALAIGIPLGIWAGVNDRFNGIVSPVLDFMQTMPTFVYLAPLALFFLIGPASATIATLIYALPPAVRYTAHGIREVPATSVEAAISLGATGRQRLTGVLLPMAKRTIVLGLNQTIMAALAMATIAALIDAPGLGKTVLKALETLDVGNSFNAGLAIVVMAICLDRITTAASRRAEVAGRGRAPKAWTVKARRPALVIGGIVTLVAIYLSRTYLWAADFPTTLGGANGTDINIGNDIAKRTSIISDWVQLNASDLTNGFKDVITSVLIDPLQTLFVESPWWLIAFVLISLAALFGDRRAVITTVICLAVLLGTGLWQDTMTTLAMTLVATAVTILLGLLIGVSMARNRRVDSVVRPILDAFQTMPAFVYLVPFVALFAASRFTAIVAAVLYAAPVSIKIVADGVAAVSPTTVEAAIASGSNTWQIITKVQLPMAREALTLAVNQGLIYVLAMVVVGGLVGAGALGYDVVSGFSRGELFGKGLAAGIAIVALGIMLNRITVAAAERQRTA
ncbi:MAG TPA: ABC transporter permease subunit [Kineosporiaceae bacterium]|nr:ABC transporter permease subunit [Kineosporiaceae bacterium]